MKLRYIIARLEDCVKNKMTYNCEKYIIIEDSKDVAWENISIAMVKNIISFLEKNYPERIFRLYIVNNGPLSLFIWNIVKPFIPKGTVDKVKIWVYFVEYSQPPTNLSPHWPPADLLDGQWWS